MNDTPPPADDQPLDADGALIDAQVAATWYDLGYFDGEADDDTGE